MTVMERSDRTVILRNEVTKDLVTTRRRSFAA